MEYAVVHKLTLHSASFWSNAPINVKPEGGGRADHGISIVSAVPRVGILIVRDAPRVGILIVCHPHGGEI